MSGLGICERFYFDVVRPQVDVPHSAALMGRGSEVLGFDDEMSSDHNYEARVLLFVAEGVELRPELPATFEGRPTQVDVHPLRKYFADQLTFDIDAVDPAFAPGTGTPEVGGLSSHDAQLLVRGLAGLSLVGGDIVEVSPVFDGPGQITALLAANLMFEFLCVLARGRTGVR